MADKVRFVPDSAGLKAWMVANLSEVIQEHGTAIAAEIAAKYGVAAEAVYEIGDRPRSAVHIPNGALLQAKHGAATQAASARGLEVKAP